MTSDERRKIRYLRRKAKREKVVFERSNKYANLDNAFVFSKVMYYSDKCCNGVRWKKSTQFFIIHQFTNIANTCYKIKNNKYRVGRTYHFTINERGKLRDIDAPHINDRLVHKVLSNEVLLPLYEPHLIYDNGASKKNKGFIFAINRLKKKLRHFYNSNGYNGYIVLIDYSKFFENCNHDIIRDIHRKYIKNEYTRKVIEDYLFIGKGIALGVEIAQQEACMIPNSLDHFIQNNGGKVVRYMDDTCFIIDKDNNIINMIVKYIDMANDLGIVVNPNKTIICFFNDYFKFCKWNYRILLKGKVINVPDIGTIYRQRRKIRRMNNLYKMEKINYYDMKITKECFKAYLDIGNSYKFIKFLDRFLLTLILLCAIF